MPKGICTEIGEGFQDQGLDSLALAILFWIGGAFAWAYSHGMTWPDISDYLSKLTLAQSIIVLLGMSFFIVISSNIMKLSARPVFGLVEGYWPEILTPLKMHLINRINCRVGLMEDRWIYLANKYDNLSKFELEEYARIDTELDEYPLNPLLRLPTMLGNLHRSAEEYPSIRYGMDIYTVWPRLWLILPDNMQREINHIQNIINNYILLMMWSILFGVWSVWSLWVLPIASAGALLAHINLVHSFRTYGDLIKATFDLYRFSLYESLKMPFPASPEDEHEFGIAITQYLKRGIPPRVSDQENLGFFIRIEKGQKDM
jgi:hypothetical protein